MPELDLIAALEFVGRTTNLSGWYLRKVTDEAIKKIREQEQEIKRLKNEVSKHRPEC